MFTWICPKCGREVGPSYSECPFCAEAAAKAGQAPAPPVPQPQYPPQPQYQAPPPPPPAPVAPPPPPQPQLQTYLVGEPERKLIPGWLAAVLAFAAIGAVVFGIVYFARNNRESSTPKAETKKDGAPTVAYAKYLELTGFRINEAPGKKLQVQFLAVNHGAADLASIEGTITLRVKGSPEAEPAATFSFTIASVPAFGAKEIIITNFTQKRKFFDMPDWQFLEPVVEYTSSE